MIALGTKPGGSVTPRSASDSLWVRPVVKMVPKIETPKEAPIERKKVAAAVAAPRSW